MFGLFTTVTDAQRKLVIHIKKGAQTKRNHSRDFLVCKVEKNRKKHCI